MGFLQNDWIRYFDRTYQQIKDHVLTDLQYRVPEMTDHTESNTFVKAMSIWSAISEMLGYYIDNAAREAILDSCRLYSSGISHARRSDYRVKGKLAGVCTVQFTLNAVQTSVVNIPAGTLVKVNRTGVTCSTLNNVSIPIGQLSVTVEAQQFTPITGLNLAATSGAANNEIIVGTDVQDRSVTVSINNETWASVLTLGFSLPTDKHFIETVDKDYNQVIIFGDGVNGAIPAGGQIPIVGYNSTLGVLGTADVGDIDTIVSVLVIPAGASITVTNTTILVGGSDVETLDQIKSRVPKSNRTLDRAVTTQDYIDVAELAPGVEKAGLVFDCGKTINIYIVGIGGGLASPALIASTDLWFKSRKMATTFVNVLPAGEIRLKLAIRINALPQFRNADVYNTVMANLVAFGNYTNQAIRGEVNIGDIYQTVENSLGVKNSVLDVMTPIPYARPLDDNTEQLDWTRVIKPGSLTTKEWRIIFIDPSNYEVLLNNGYLGQYAVGQTVDHEEITFTINSDYTSGASWEFFTYPYYGTVILQEPSIPVIYAEDVELTVIGGL